MDELDRMTNEAFKEAEKTNIILILDDIRSMANVGSIFRTADCFLVSKIYLCGITATPPHREIEKTALGATESVDWEYVENARELVLTLKSNGVKVFAIEQVENSISLVNFKPIPDDHYALILGNEVFGVNQDLVNMADGCIEIPQFGTKHSFNVSVTNAIVLWDFYSKTTGKVL